MSEIQQFEYKIISRAIKSSLFFKRKYSARMSELELELLQLGKAGWELTGQFTQAYNGFTDKVVFIFKRPIVASF